MWARACPGSKDLQQHPKWHSEDHSQEPEGVDYWCPLVSTWEIPTKKLHLLLGPPIQEGCPSTGAVLEEGSQDGLVRSQKTCPTRRGCRSWDCSDWRRDIFGMTEQQPPNTYLRVGTKKMEPASTQWHLMGEQEAKGINWSKRGCKPSKGKASIIRRVKHWDKLSKRLHGLHPWRCSKTDFVNPWAIWSEFILFIIPWAGGWTVQLLKCLP